MQTFCGLTTDGMLDYLAAIYRLDTEHERVTTGGLAAMMHVSAAAASSMLKRLEEGNFVERSNADGIVLTEQGRLAALQLIRRHRLLEVFLVEVMGYTWDQVSQEAYALQHSISSLLEDRIDALCGFPTHCPHGDPIPTRDGTIVVEQLASLLELPPGCSREIRRVATQDARVLRYLAGLGLMPGRTVTLQEIGPFKGPVTVELVNDSDFGGSDSPDDATQHILGHELAGLIEVERLTDFAPPAAVAPRIVEISP